MHTCQCPNCKPEAFPRTNKIGPWHEAVRFGDWRPPDRSRAIFVDGEDVSSTCCEALYGSQGFVIVFNTDLFIDTNWVPLFGVKHICQTCHRDGCQEIRHGMVETRIKERKYA